jgi:hypothetical protein
MREELLSTTRALEPQARHELKFYCLRHSSAVHEIAILGFPSLLQLRLVPLPLVCDSIVTAETPDRDNHCGDYFWNAVRNQF